MKQLFISIVTIFVANLSSGQNRDTIIEVTSNHLPKQFICNSGPCSGDKKGFYSNGNVEIRGRFRKGKAIGKVINYTINGHIETVRFFQKGNLQRSLGYDTLGRLTRDLNWKKKHSTTYYYGATGDVIRKEIFLWKNVGWTNGITEVYEMINNQWVKVDKNRS